MIDMYLYDYKIERISRYDMLIHNEIVFEQVYIGVGKV